MDYGWGKGRGKVNQMIAEEYFPARGKARREAVGIYGGYTGVGTPAQMTDGFGWVTLHRNGNDRVSSGGAWRSKGASWAAKQSVPFASNIVIWDFEKMMVTMKRYWAHYTEEEREDINRALAGYGLRTQSAAEARRSSPFVQWSERADSPAPVDEGSQGGGHVHDTVAA